MASAGEGPYVGPRPFERSPEDRARFFGRDAEVREIVSLIVSHPLVLVYAQSGAGKTSLFNTAVSAALEGLNVELLPLARVRGDPGDLTAAEIPNLYVFGALQSLAPKGNRAELARLSLAEHLRSTRGEDAHTRVLVFDQFEELFTFEVVYDLYGDAWQEQQRGFFDQVAEAISSDPMLRIVFVMRKEYLAEVERFAPLLPERLRTRFHLEPLDGDEALAAVEGPLRDAEPPRSFADGVARNLVNRLLLMRVGPERDVRGRFVEPVQLQVVCRSLWQSLPPDATTITESDVKAFGDVDTVLGGFYDEAVGAAASAAHVREGRLRAKLEDDFITSIGTRGTVYLEDWQRLVPALEELERRHVVHAEFRSGTRWYELTHDRLIDPIRASNAARRRRRTRRLALAAALAAASAALVLAALAVLSQGGESPPGAALVVPPPDATILISSASGTVGTPSRFVITVNTTNRVIASSGGRAVARILNGPGTFVGAPSCTYRGGRSTARCTVAVVSRTAGTTVVSASTSVRLETGVVLHRTTNGRRGSSVPAQTSWLEAEVVPGISISPRRQSIRQGRDARFTVRVRNTRTTVIRGVTVTAPLVRTCERTFPSLQPGRERTYTCSLPDVRAAFTNVVTMTSSAPDTWTDSAQVAVVVPAPPYADYVVRQSIVDAAHEAARKHAQIEYSPDARRMQGVRDRIRLPNVPRYEDTSSFVTWLYWQAGAPDPNGNDYDGTGTTATLISRGKETTSPLPGDLVFYGTSKDSPLAVGVYLGDGRVVIHRRQEPSPSVLPVRFDRAFPFLEYRAYTLRR